MPLLCRQLTGLREELRSGSFRPDAVKQRAIPKRGGKLRYLGIATVRDRVVQAALKLVLEPIFEVDFEPCSYGFRPGRRAWDAIAEVRHFSSRSYEWILEADIQACFDELSHPAILGQVRRRVVDKRVLALIKAFMKAGILTEQGTLERTITGTPQGGILSPLMANVALSVLDQHLAMMDVIVERSSALDVHKASVTACVRVPASDGGREPHLAEFATTVRGLLGLRDWLVAHRVTQVVMEATGVYWKPVVRHEALSDRVG